VSEFYRSCMEASGGVSEVGGAVAEVGRTLERWGLLGLPAVGPAELLSKVGLSDFHLPISEWVQ
jgi:hypothetical protein